MNDRIREMALERSNQSRVLAKANRHRPLNWTIHTFLLVSPYILALPLTVLWNHDLIPQSASLPLGAPAQSLHQTHRCTKSSAQADFLIRRFQLDSSPISP